MFANECGACVWGGECCEGICISFLNLGKGGTKAQGRCVICVKLCTLINEQDRQEVLGTLLSANCGACQSHCLSLSALASLCQWPSCSMQVWLSEKCSLSSAISATGSLNQIDRSPSVGYFPRSLGCDQYLSTKQVICFSVQVPLKL